MTRKNPVPEWQSGLPSAFCRLCDHFEIVSREQGWVLALALHQKKAEFPGGATFKDAEIEDIMKRLTPPLRYLCRFSDEPALPLGGAIDPASATFSVSGVRGQGQIDLAQASDAANVSSQPRLNGTDDEEEEDG